MTPVERASLLTALEATERAAEALRRVLGPRKPSGEALVSLAQACRAWGCTKDAALKRARRGLGRKVAGKWFVPASAVNTAGGADKTA